MLFLFNAPQKLKMAQSAGDPEYIDCISAEGLDFPNECPVYDTKQSDGEASVMLWAMWSTFYCHHSQIHSGPEW